jgi:hypothetical protein
MAVTAIPAKAPEITTRTPTRSLSLPNHIALASTALPAETKRPPISAPNPDLIISSGA